MKKSTKEKLFLYFVIFSFSLFMCHAFLQRHYATDTYVLMDKGYFQYAYEFFFHDVRFFSAILCCMGGILHLPYDTYILISGMIGVGILSFTIFILFRFLICKLSIENHKYQLLTLFVTYILILNPMSIEYLLYQEAASMCLGVLFSVLASITYLKNSHHKYVISFSLLFLSSICYQGLINLFPVLVIAINFLSKTDGVRKSISNYVMEVIKLGLIFAGVMLVNFLFMILIADFTTIGATNRFLQINLYSIFYTLFLNLKSFLIYQLGVLPKYFSIFFIGITIVLLLIFSKQKKKSIQYILLVITAYLFCLVPILFFGYFQPRMAMGLGAIYGISLLFLICTLQEDRTSIRKEWYRENIIIVLVGICFVLNTINYIRLSNQHIMAWKIDENLGSTIAYKVKEYEQKTGNTITKFSYVYDTNPKQYARGIKPLVSLTERKFMVKWCIVEAFEYYCGKELEKVEMSNEIYEEYFEGKNYDCFLEEQLIFINDTAYFITY